MRKKVKTERQARYFSRLSVSDALGAGGVDTYSCLETFGAEYMDRLMGNTRTPEEMLLLAVLEDAIYLVRFPKITRSGGEKGAVEDARVWFASDQADRPFDFMLICEHFGFNPRMIRENLNSARAKRGRTSNRQVTYTEELFETEKELPFPPDFP